MSAEFFNETNKLKRAIDEVLEVGEMRQDAHRHVNAFFQHTPYGQELKTRIVGNLPFSETAPQDCVSERLATFIDYGWMKNLDLGRVNHPKDWRGADRLQLSVQDDILDLYDAGLAPSGLLNRDDPRSKCQTVVSGLSYLLGRQGFYGGMRNRYLGCIQFPGEEPIFVVKRSEFILVARRFSPEYGLISQWPALEGQTHRLQGELLDYAEEQIALQEKGNGSVVPVRTGIFVYRDQPNLVGDAAAALVTAGANEA